MKKNNPALAVFRNYSGILLGLLVLCVAMCFASPYFMTGSNVLNILRQVSVNAILAYGMTFAILIGGIDLSVGPVQSMAGVICAVMIGTLGCPVWLSILSALTAGMLCGFVNGFIITKTGMPPFIVTMSMMSVCKGLAYTISGGGPVRVMESSFNQIGTGFIGVISYPVIYMLVLFAVAYYLLNHTAFGRQVYAIGGNRETARFSGINIHRTEIFVFVLSAFLAAFTGVFLTARMYTGQPSVGDGAELDAIAAVVLGGTSMSGGRGRIGGTLIGAVVIGVISNSLNLLNVSSFTQMIAKGIVIVGAVYIDTLNKRQRV